MEFPSTREVWLVTGRFRIVSELARGGMGVTYRAMDEAMGVPVVVKMPRKALVDEAGFLERFDREVRASAALAHAHIVPVVAHGVDDGLPFMAMRFLPGGSLADRIPRRPDGVAKPAAAARLHTWLPGIAAALDFAHDKGILHRDVKPANIFFDGFDNAYLGDFGIAKVLEDSKELDPEHTLTNTNVAVGMQQYMAPERFAPQAPVDRRSDQYSLAIAVYELLAGRRPFSGSRAHIVVEHATIPPPALAAIRPDLPATLCAAVHRGLAKNPLDRFATCAEFARAVVQAVPPPPAERTCARLLCPACRKILKLPLSAGGKRGSCSRCDAQLSIAPDLGALWLRSESTKPQDEPDLGALSTLQSDSMPVEQYFSDRIDLTSGPVAFAIGTALFIATALIAAMLLPTGDWSPSGTGQQTIPTATTPPPGPKPESVATASPRTDADSADTPSDRAPTSPEPMPAEQPAAQVGPEPAASAAVVEPSPAARPTAPLAPLLATMEWVRVGDPGNEPDANGLGSVPDAFLIGRHEITNGAFCQFLNASKAGRDNVHGIGDRAARSHPIESPDDAACGIVIHRSFDGSCIYSVAPGMERMPVNTLWWCDAARFANWLHNGGMADSDTETGAYRLAGAQFDVSEALPREPAATVWIPSVDEWYKAAFFRGGTADAGYWDYPTRSNDFPAIVKATQEGTGIRTPDGNSANFNSKAEWLGALKGANVPKKWLRSLAVVTAVGTNGRPSPCGATDMAGNAAELVIFFDGETGLPEPRVCGGDYRTKFVRELSGREVPSSPQGVAGGIRLARCDDPTIDNLPQGK